MDFSRGTCLALRANVRLLFNRHQFSSNRFGRVTNSTLKSFAEVVGKVQTEQIDLKSPSMYREEPALFFSDEDIVRLSSSFKFALVGKFLHGRPALLEVRAAMVLFRMKASVSVGLLDLKHVLLRSRRGLSENLATRIMVFEEVSKDSV